jgi:DNA invertase Pin-like site-specific DNA recombinase
MAKTGITRTTVLVQAVDNTEEPHKIGYARISTADQNPELQIAALKNFGVHEDDIYWEQGSGASTNKRKQYQAMMKDVREGDIVVVWKLDRLGRNASQLYETYRQIQEKGADLQIVTNPTMNTRTAMGKAMFGMLAVFAEFEREMIHERTMAGLKAAREAGRVGGVKAMHSDEKVLEASRFGMARGAARLGMSKPGFIKAVKRAKDRLPAAPEQKESAA